MTAVDTRLIEIDFPLERVSLLKHPLIFAIK